MAQWIKLLGAMVADRKPISYTYEDASTVLRQLQFTMAKSGATSHRKWYRELADATAPSGHRTVTIGLNAKGKGPLKPGYIRAMVRTLRENNLLPDGVSDL